jgi:arginine/lysine/ornithine decarboxylase
VPVSDAQARAPYLDALVEYAGRDPGRLHVPGHKGGPGVDPQALEALGAPAFDLDIPALIEGIDVPPPEPTPFQLAQDLAAEAWGAQRSWFLINGASQGNKAACLAVRHSGTRVVVQRNVHSSTIDGLIVGGLEPTFVAPEVDPDLGIAHCVTPESLDQGLEATPDAIAAIVVSPTYFGAVADVAGLTEVAHDHGVPLLVDEAWGAHLRFCDRLPASALSQGADVVLSSVHKILGSLTQSAILHVGSGELVQVHDFDRAVTLTESTSPSALLCASLDAARRHAMTRGEELLSETIDALQHAREQVRAMPGLDVLDSEIGRRPGVHGWDPVRLSIDVRGTGTTGHRVAALMHELDDVNLELASESVVVAVFGMGAPAARDVDRLLGSLRHAITTLGDVEHEPARPFAPPPPWGTLRMPPRDAFLAPQDVVTLGDAEGRVAAESLATYPPGIPNVLPGEVLTAETLDYVRETLAHGGKVRGAVDRTLRTIRVVTP